MALTITAISLVETKFELRHLSNKTSSKDIHILQYTEYIASGS